MLDYSTYPDSKLIWHIKRRSNEAVFEMRKRYEKIFYKIVSKYAKILPDFDSGEILKDLEFLVYDSAKKFDKTRNCRFSTFFYLTCRFHILNRNRILKPLYCAENNTLDFWNNEQGNTLNPDYANDDIIKFILKILDNLPDKRIRQIFDLKYYQGKPWKEISKILKLSGTQCINLENFGKKAIRDKLKKENLIPAEI